MKPGEKKAALARKLGLSRETYTTTYQGAKALVRKRDTIAQVGNMQATENAVTPQGLFPLEYWPLTPSIPQRFFPLSGVHVRVNVRCAIESLPVSESNGNRTTDCRTALQPESR